MTTMTTLILDITNEQLTACQECGAEQQASEAGSTEAPATMLTDQHSALMLECAQLGHAYAITRTVADEAYTKYQLLNVQSQEAWQTHCEHSETANQLEKAFHAAMRKRRELFGQIKAQTEKA